ncbi:MFS transporter [Olivibacter sp. SDN3]|nr:MFS transporter [Olivibacter sp. SDN3]
MLTLIGVLLALFLGALDQTIVATALPKIASDLQGIDRFSWVATAYLVASTTLVPIYGKLADMYNQKKIELTAICIFLIGSFLCGVSGEFGSLPLIGDGMNQLILFRTIQGIGGAGLFAMAFIIIAGLFPPAERGKYQGMVGAVFGLSSVLGPTLGGLLADHGSMLVPGIEGWRWVFYVNVPFGALALWFIAFRMPNSVSKKTVKKFDYLSALLLIAALMPLVTALQMHGSDHSEQIFRSALFIFAFIAFILLYFRSIRSDNPILNLQLFSNSVFKTANTATFLIGISFMSLVIFMPLYMVNVLQMEATTAGLTMVPLSAGMLIGSIGAGQIVSRINHYKMILLISIAFAAVGVFLLTTMNMETKLWEICMYLTICGIGLGPTMPLFPLIVQNAVDPNEIGQSTSAVQFFRQIGGAIGASLMGAILNFNLAKSKHQFAELTGEISTRSQAPTPMELQSLISTAATQIFITAFFIMLLAWAITWLVPQLVLRKTND